MGDSGRPEDPKKNEMNPHPIYPGSYQSKVAVPPCFGGCFCCGRDRRG